MIEMIRLPLRTNYTAFLSTISHKWSSYTLEEEKNRDKAGWIERTRVSSPWIGPFNYSLQRETERSMHTIESKPRMERLDRHRAERQTSLLTSPISPGNRALSLSLFLDSYLSLPGRNRNYKRRKEPRADRSVRALTDSIREWRRWCLSNRLCSQRHATKSRRERKREIDICVYTRPRSGK